MPNGLFSIETRAGDPISTGKLKLVPFAQVFQLRFPLFNGGLVWNRPVSVLAIAQDGTEQIIPVRDHTRRAQILILAVGLFASLIFWITNRTNKNI